MNIFLNSYLIYKVRSTFDVTLLSQQLLIVFLHLLQTSLYLSFGVMCALVIIDTVRIIDLRARGDTDYIM